MARFREDPGDLSHRIIIWTKTTVQDEHGQDIETDVEFHRCWAAFGGMVGTEYWQAQQAHAGVSIEVKIRFLPGVKPAMWIEEPSTDGRLEIAGPPVDRDGKKKYLYIPCKEAV